MTTTKRVVIETERGEINGVYTNIKDLEVRVLNQDDVLRPVDELINEANGRGEKAEIDDRVDVSFEPETVDLVFEHAGD